jgi:hypothetical protein
MEVGICQGCLRALPWGVRPGSGQVWRPFWALLDGNVFLLPIDLCSSLIDAVRVLSFAPLSPLPLSPLSPVSSGVEFKEALQRPRTASNSSRIA